MSDSASLIPKTELSVENHAEVRIAPSYDHAGITIYNGDALEILPLLPAESVHCCVTSPPYWGLRDYGTAKWEGGDEGCEHEGHRSMTGAPGSDKQASNHGANAVAAVACRHCGAKRIDSQIGLETSPGEYISRLVSLFAEVRRVLRKDGTLWLNLGDSYSATTKGSGGHNPKQDSNVGAWHSDRKWQIPSGLKPKDLCGIPWRVAFALQEAGWWLRSDIIWAKPAPMPESVTDRPTRSHEYIFLLAKSERYYYDAAAIAERSTYAGKNVSLGEKSLSRGQATGANVSASGNGTAAFVTVTETRNKRDVWTINGDPFPEAHFATFPPALILPCVLAGCPAGGLVLDPFSGAGTTALVAKEQGRRAIGIELNANYVAMTARRLSQDVLFSTLDSDVVIR